jgi:hypothetical protein
MAVVVAFLTAIRDLARRRADLTVEVLALRHQVLVLQWLTGVLGVEPPTRGAIVMAAPAIEFVTLVVFAIWRFLRCPQCRRFDVLLAYGRMKTRRCEGCGAETR